MSIKEQVIKKSALSPTVLIAGGAGFIGSHIAEKFIEKGARVIVLDNFETGKDVYISSLLKNPKFASFNVDINKGIPSKIQGVDYVIHLAGVESYLYDKDSANLNSLLTNAVGTKNLLDLAHKSNAKFLLVSSIDVYQGVISPLDLEHYFGQTTEEEKKYSLIEAKRFSEALVWEYFKHHETDARIVRIPEIYGPRMNLASSGNLGRLIKALVDNKNLEVLGEGVEKELYLYIGDAISGMIKALLNKDTEGKIFTLVPEETRTVLETTYLLKGLANKDTGVDFKPKLGNKSHRNPVIPDTSTSENLGWKSKTNFKEGLKKTLEWLGYEANEHTFKPAKLIEEKLRKSTHITSLIGLGAEKEEEAKEETNELYKQKEIKETQREGAPIVVMAKGSKKISKPSLGSKIKQKLGGFKLAKQPKSKVKTEIKEGVNLNKLKRVTAGVSKTKVTVAGIILALLLVTLAPLVITGIQYGVAKSGSKKTAEYFMALDYENGIKEAKKTRNASIRTKNSFTNLKWLFLVSGKRAEYITYNNLLESASYFSQAAYEASLALEPFTKIWGSLKPNSQYYLNTEEFKEASKNMGEAKNNLQLALAEYKNVDKSLLGTKMQTKVEEYEVLLKLAVENVGIAQVLAQEIPNITGLETPKKYMILFQNSNEIRPTGGFIGSYAILDMEKGKITSLTIDDIYNPDGQLDVKEIQNTPPEPIKTYLEEENLHIRNANWNPDFEQSATVIKDLFNQATGVEVNGIIAIDLKLVEKLLEITGPIYLTAFNEEITHENLYEKTQMYSEFNYENGSNQKRSFLTTLGGKLMESLFTIPQENVNKLLGMGGASLSERHMSIYLFDTPLSTKLEELGWSGSLGKTDKDYLQVVNANVGGTKANYYVKNDMKYSVEALTRDGLLRGALTLSYDHTGTNSAWPGGPYKNYVRVLTQEGTKLTGAEIKYREGAKTNIFEEIIIDKVGGYTSYETFFELNPQDSVDLTFYYDLPQNLSITSNNNEYGLLWQKQAGTSEDTFTFMFEPPFGFDVAGEKFIRSEGTMSTDFTTSFTLN